LLKNWIITLLLLLLDNPGEVQCLQFVLQHKQEEEVAGGSTDATADNDTTTVGGERNLSTSIVKDFIEEACIALQIGDTEGALDLLNQALDELGGGGVGHTR
jgi:hypothetical protein